MAENLTYLNIRYQPMHDKDYRQKEYSFWTEYLQYLTDGIPFAGSKQYDLNFRLIVIHTELINSLEMRTKI